jgi:imidazolonepropionase
VKRASAVAFPKQRPLLLFNIGQLVTLRGGSVPQRGRALGELGIVEDAAVLCAEGKIVAAGKWREIKRRLPRDCHEVDCDGRVVLPGLVDSHTHPVFVGPRLVDFEKRITGASYEEMARAGGGIRSSVEPVRRASVWDLVGEVGTALVEMARYGTTTVECKSGYGLSVEAELKSLQAIRETAQRWPGTVVATLLGAHVVPREFARRRREYVRQVCEQMIPRAAAEGLARYVDVFVESEAFTEAEAEQIFAAARQHGLGSRMHVCQLSGTSAGWLARVVKQFAIASVDHVDRAGARDVAALAKLDVAVTLLPGSNYFLGLQQYPEARKLIAAGAAVALATDYNPGTSPTASMQMVMSLACTQMKMTPAEAIAAATINPAWSLGLADRKGSVEAGKDADMAIFNCSDYREIAYWFGGNKCWGTVMAGKVMRW